jgi:glycosyltransferase involved in cell wall biosynthesis
MQNLQTHAAQLTQVSSSSPPHKLLIATTIAASLRGFFIPFADYFRARGWQVDGIAQDATSCTQCVAAYDHVWDIPWSRNPLDAKNLLQAPSHLRELLQEHQYDLINVSTPVASFVTRMALNHYRDQGRVKVIYTAQGFHFYKGGSPLKNAAYLAIEKVAGQWTDQLVVVNREDEIAALTNHLIPQNNVQRIPGTGVNFNRFNPDSISEEQVAALRQELGLGVGDRFFLSVAELIPRKRIDDILQAFAKLGDPAVHLVLAGKGKLLDQLQALAIHLGISANVHFLGQRSDIPVLLRAASALVLVSQHEGLPNCVIEALYSHTPVIGSDIRGTRDLLQGGSGLLVGLGEIASLTESMRWVLNNPKEAEVMTRQGRRAVLDYGIPEVLQQYETLYQTVLREIA